MSLLAGQHLDAAAMNLRGSRYARKTASTDRTSTVTVTADPHLILTLEPGLWEVTVGIHYSSIAAAAGIRTAWALSAGVALLGHRGCLGPSSTSTDRTATQIRTATQTATGESAYGHGSGLGNPAGASELGLARVTTTGTIALSWAQQTSNASATRLHAGSWIRAEFVEE